MKLLIPGSHASALLKQKFIVLLNLQKNPLHKELPGDPAAVNSHRVTGHER